MTPDLLQAMERGIPGVALSDQTGNQFQLDLNYRGFIASPVIGTPQGLAVYQNGVRINEVFGDIVNWDFIPENAISRMTLVPSNPVFGLNAIGGALSLEMKNGFTYQGVQGEVNGGSYGRIGTSVQAGGQVGSFPAISPPTQSTMPAGATTRRRRCGASTWISARAAIRPNSTSTLPAQTIISAPQPRRRANFSPRAGRASTRFRKPPRTSSPS